MKIWVKDRMTQALINLSLCTDTPFSPFRLIFQENSSQFNEQNYLQTHGNPMGTETAVAFANIFMAKIEVQILDKGANKPLVLRLRHSLVHDTSSTGSLYRQINAT